MKTAFIVLAAASIGFFAGVIWAALGRISKEADREPADVFEDLH